jgi:hypothetical protein
MRAQLIQKTGKRQCCMILAKPVLCTEQALKVKLGLFDQQTVLNKCFAHKLSFRHADQDDHQYNISGSKIWCGLECTTDKAKGLPVRSPADKISILLLCSIVCFCLNGRWEPQILLKVYADMRA